LEQKSDHLNRGYVKKCHQPEMSSLLARLKKQIHILEISGGVLLMLPLLADIIFRRDFVSRRGKMRLAQRCGNLLRGFEKSIQWVRERRVGRLEKRTAGVESWWWRGRWGEDHHVNDHVVLFQTTVSLTVPPGRMTGQ
jgi:hypothetical protein